MKKKNIPISSEEAQRLCQGCKHCLNHQCDILGAITSAALQTCRQAGYSEYHYRITTVRHYHNTRNRANGEH